MPPALSITPQSPCYCMTASQTFAKAKGLLPPTSWRPRFLILINSPVPSPQVADYQPSCDMCRFISRNGSYCKPKRPVLECKTAHIATQNIRLVCIPPHASHILQPLDRLYFSHLKQVYAGIKTTAMLSKLSKALLKVLIAFEASNVSYYICQSWRMTGINPVVEENKVVRVQLDPESLDGSPSLQHNFDGNERARGRSTRVPQWGLLNDDEIALAEAGQCPFCCGLLPPDWEWP